jgi:hypothetical protein
MGLERKKASNFLYKLYDLINGKKYINDINWSNNGNSFIIKNYENFCYKIMPKIFGLQLFSSFHHQLNCYGFIKINEQEYYNKNFTRDNPYLLLNIKRTKKKKISYKKIKNIEYKIKTMKQKSLQLEQNLYVIQKKREYLINENNFLKNKLYEVQTKQKDLGYIFFCVVENLFPEFSSIKNKCLYFINSNSVSLTDLENYSLDNINNNYLNKYNSYKIDSGISLCNTQDSKTQIESDNFMDVE